jgi:xanthine dehydrogenase YagT iron-sulfur-binding subunit
MIPLSGCQQWPHDNPAIPVGDHDSDAALTPLHGTRSNRGLEPNQLLESSLSSNCFCGGTRVQSIVSRRAFLHTSAVAGAILTEAAAAPAAEESGDRRVAIVLHVNGATHGLRVEPEATLAEALRDTLGLTGTKIACNRGACSACTVLLDRMPVCSCMTLAVDVGARQITTIEGVARGDVLHPVQRAFIEHDASQCGFCTPGMVVSCVALLEHNPLPTPADVKAAISGHYCRCGTYPHVVEAVLAIAKAGS